MTARGVTRPSDLTGVRAVRASDRGDLVQGRGDVVEGTRPALFGHPGAAVLGHRDHVPGRRQGAGHRPEMVPVVGRPPEPPVHKHDQRRAPGRRQPEVDDLLGPRAVGNGQVRWRGGPVQDAGHRRICGVARLTMAAVSVPEGSVP